MTQNRLRKPIVVAEPVSSSHYSFDILDRLAHWINRRFETKSRMSSSTLQKVTWFIGLALVYIFFQHNFDDLIRRLDKSEKKVNEKRALFIGLKSKYLFVSKQSEIEKKLSENGFVLSPHPPIKVVIEE